MERWNDRGAAIIPFGNNIILMRRERGYGKNKQIYYTIPGGGREEGERIDQTTIREMKEELGINISIVELMYKLDTVKRLQYIFLGKYESGKLGTGEGEEFQDVDYNKYGKYIPEVVSLEKLKKIKLVPTNLKKEIIKEYDYIIGKSKKRTNFKKKINNNITAKKQRNKYVKEKKQIHLETYSKLEKVIGNEKVDKKENKKSYNVTQKINNKINEIKNKFGKNNINKNKNFKEKVENKAINENKKAYNKKSKLNITENNIKQNGNFGKLGSFDKNQNIKKGILKKENIFRFNSENKEVKRDIGKTNRVKKTVSKKPISIKRKLKTLEHKEKNTNNNRSKKYSKRLEHSLGKKDGMRKKKTPKSFNKNFNFKRKKIRKHSENVTNKLKNNNKE